MMTLIAFLQALPDLIKLVREIQAKIEADSTNQKVKDHVQVIHEAFATKDATKLNALFNSAGS